MTQRRQFNKTIIAAMAGLCLGQNALAQGAEAWPARPIRLVVPALPGGALDICARALGERLGSALKQPVIIDNKPGGSGVIATKAVMQSPADGYTMLYTSASATVMIAALKPETAIDFTKDLEPVGSTVFGGVLLAVHPSVPAKDVKELVALVKAKPDQYSYASFGQGSNGHLTMEWLKSQTGMHIQHVAYKSVAPVLTEMSAGIIQVGWVDLVGALPFIQSGKIRAIAANGTARAPQLPDVPTMGEQGYPFPGTGWQGLFAPKGTPQAVIARINTEINRILMTREMVDLSIRLNLDQPQGRSTDQFRELLVRDLAVWKRIVAEGNIKAD